MTCIMNHPCRHRCIMYDGGGDLVGISLPRCGLYSDWHNIWMRKWSYPPPPRAQEPAMFDRGTRGRFLRKAVPRHGGGGVPWWTVMLVLFSIVNGGRVVLMLVYYGQRVGFCVFGFRFLTSVGMGYGGVC